MFVFIKSCFITAFDCLSHNFIKEFMILYNFSISFIKMIENCLEDKISWNVLDDKSFTEFFKIGKGTCQGNPLSF